LVLLDTNAAIVSQLKQIQQTKQKFGTQDPGSALAARFAVSVASIWLHLCQSLVLLFANHRYLGRQQLLGCAHRSQNNAQALCAFSRHVGCEKHVCAS
jgi:hypothetical protein